MKLFWGAWAALFLLSACGGNEQIDLDREAANFVHNKFESSAVSCDEGPEVSLVQDAAVGYSPKIKFVASKNIVANSRVLNNEASISQRCKEIQNHFSGASLGAGTKTIPNNFSLEIDFSGTEGQEQQLLLGKNVSMRPESAYLSFTDGSLKDTGLTIEIRCPGSASVSCHVEEIGDYKKCESYNVNYSDACTFREKLVLFSFSDHKKAMLDVSGKIDIAENGRTRINFTKISWTEVY